MPSTPCVLQVEHRASLRAHNSFGLPATAATLVRVGSVSELRRVVDHPEYRAAVELSAEQKAELARDFE